MREATITRISLPTLLWRGLREEARERGWVRAVTALIGRVAEVVRDSFPDRRRMRFGDVQYDIEHNVNTTWANVGFATRLREALIGATYQTTDPEIFAEAIEMLRSTSEFAESSSAFCVPSSEAVGSEFAAFTFVDLGSGKGRVLLMAAEYGFRRIVGVELLPDLHEVARENVRDPRIHLVLGDAREFVWPEEPLVVFLFNPFPEWVVRDVMRRLWKSVTKHRRPVFVVFHNAVHEQEVLAAGFRRVTGTHQFGIYTA